MGMLCNVLGVLCGWYAVPGVPAAQNFGGAWEAGVREIVIVCVI
jgi:hypothetical protein